MIKAVLFDLDNTLIDFLKLKRMSCEAAISSMISAGLGIKQEEALETLFALYDKHGLEEKKIFQKFLLKVSGKIDYKILANGIVAYRRVRASYLEPYPGTDYVLLKLKSSGIKLGIVTDAPKLKAWLRLASTRLSNFFDIVIAFEDTKSLKPSKLPFLKALNSLKIKPQECIMVGDWPERDIKGASSVGIKTCFARYGNPGKEAKSDYIINKISELLKIINKENVSQKIRN